MTTVAGTAHRRIHRQQSVTLEVPAANTTGCLLSPKRVRRVARATKKLPLQEIEVVHKIHCTWQRSSTILQVVSRRAPRPRTPLPRRQTTDLCANKSCARKAKPRYVDSSQATYLMVPRFLSLMEATQLRVRQRSSRRGRRLRLHILFPPMPDQPHATKIVAWQSTQRGGTSFWGLLQGRCG